MSYEKWMNILEMYSTQDAESCYLLDRELTAVSKKSIRVVGFEGWIPKSVLKTDPSGQLYVARWFWDKHF